MLKSCYGQKGRGSAKKANVYGMLRITRSVECLDVDFARSMRVATPVLASTPS